MPGTVTCNPSPGLIKKVTGGNLLTVSCACSRSRSWGGDGGIRAGSEGHLYGLSGLGQAVLGVSGPLGRRRRSMWETKPWFQDHTLAISELYVRLVEINRDGTAELLAFDAEPTCWRRFTGIGGQRVVLKPDASVCLGLGEFEQRAFIELD